jgi:hypothetical protein
LNKIKLERHNIFSYCERQKCKKHIGEKEIVGVEPTKPAPGPKFSEMGPKVKKTIFRILQNDIK